MKASYIALLLLITFYISACGDNSPEQVSAASLASVNIGADMNAIEQESFTLSATVYPTGGKVNWTQLKGPAIEGFPFLDTASISVASPEIAIDTEFVFQAEYITEDAQLVYDEVSVFVTDLNQPPIAAVTIVNETLPPFSVYEVITLSAATSNDIDGEIRGYQWQQIDDNPELNFVSDKTSSTVMFKGPLVTEITNYKVALTVTDNYGAQSTNIADIAIAPADSDIAAYAGDDVSVIEFTIVNLDGSESVSSVSDITCTWTQLSGTTASVEDMSSCSTSFVAPDVDSTENLVFEIFVRDDDNNTQTDQVIVTVIPSQLGSLHDTGVTDCYNNTDLIECGGTDFPNQDAEYGRDQIADSLDKSGSGPRGFDFTKFDVHGDELPNDALVFSCVRDNLTGLIWEVKQAQTVPKFGALRGVENYYSYNETNFALSSCPSQEGCGVMTFLEEVNAQTFCGGSNWRLPTFMELLQILDYHDLNSDYLLDSEFFPFSPNSAELGHKFYWVSESNAEGGASSFQWVIDLETGDDSAISVSASAYVILVRSL